MRYPGVVVMVASGVFAVSGVSAQTYSDTSWRAHVQMLHQRAVTNALDLRMRTERAVASQRTINAGTLGSVVVVRTVPAEVGSKTVPVLVTQAVPAVKLARSLARAIPVVGTVLTVADLLIDARVKEGFGGGLIVDDGVPLQTITTSGFQLEHSSQPVSHSTVMHSSFASAQSAMVTFLNANCIGGLRFDGFCHGSSDPKQSTGQKFTFTGWSCPSTAHNTDCTGTKAVVSRYWDSSLLAWQYSSSSTQSSFVKLLRGAPQQLQSCAVNQTTAWWDTTKCTTAPTEWVAYPAAHVAAVERLRLALARAPSGVPIAEILARDAELDADAPVLTGPSSVHDGRTSTQDSSGTTVVDRYRDITYRPGNNPGLDLGSREETRVYPPGSTIPEPGQPAPPPGQIIVTPPGQAPQNPLSDLITCGLPTTPPCKIDEGGTPPPVGPDVLGGGPDSVEPLRAIIENPQVADTSFTWSFSLPSSCSVIALGTFGGREVSFDLCRYQPLIHDVMGMFWLGLGILAAWGMVTRTLS